MRHLDNAASARSNPEITPGTISGTQTEFDASEMRLLAVAAVARHLGYELDRSEYHLDTGDTIPSPISLVKWLRDQGLVAKASRLVWAQLFRLTEAAGGAPPSPAVLLFTDGAAGVRVGADPNRGIVWIRDPRSTGNDAVAVDRLRLSQLWSGETILVRRPRGKADGDPPFALSWVLRLLANQRSLMRDIAVASLTISVLTIIPPLLVMSVIDRVVGITACRR